MEIYDEADFIPVILDFIVKTKLRILTVEFHPLSMQQISVN
jgi:hypothetical protein